MSVIKIENLTKKYDEIVALNSLNIEVNSGEIFGFLGPNGAGKTTTIRLILGLQQPTSGTIEIFGHKMSTSLTDIYKKIGYIPGDLQLFDHIKAGEIIKWFIDAHKIGDTSYVNSLIERFRVTLDRPVRELSKGNRQKIGLVLAFMHQPDLLILDEPTSGLDPLMQTEFEVLVKETASASKTIFLSSHDLDEVQRIANTVAIINSGQLMAVDKVENLRNSTPLKIEAEFRTNPNPIAFSNLADVEVVAISPNKIILEVKGEIGPALGILAGMNPIDVICRRANLEELFLNYYGKTVVKRQ